MNTTFGKKILSLKEEVDCLETENKKLYSESQRTRLLTEEVTEENAKLKNKISEFKEDLSKS